MMNFYEFKEMMKNVKVTDDLEFDAHYRMLIFDGPPPDSYKLVSIGSSTSSCIKVPAILESTDDSHNTFTRLRKNYNKIKTPVTSISKKAFSQNKNITDILLPSTVTEIEEGAFSNCINLRSITIPKGVTKIRERTFEGCVNLKDIYYEGTHDEWKKIEIIHQKHEREFGKIIPGTPVQELISDRLIYIPGNEAVFTADIHLRCNIKEMDSVIEEKDPEYFPSECSWSHQYDSVNIEEGETTFQRILKMLEEQKVIMSDSPKDK